MADIDIFTLVNTKQEVEDRVLLAETTASAATALKLDASTVGGDNGIPILASGFIQSADTDWADNADVLAGTSAVKVMNPIRVLEQMQYFIDTAVGLTSVSTGVTQVNTFNIAHSKATYFDTVDLSTNGHFTVSAINQEITINTTGIYKISGVIEIEADNNDIVYLQAHVNAAPVSVTMRATGRGAGKPVGIAYNGVASMTTGDVFTVYGGSDVDATSVSITACSVSLEKTIHA